MRARRQTRGSVWEPSYPRTIEDCHAVVLERTAIERDGHAARQTVGDRVDTLVAGDAGVSADVVPRDALPAARARESIQFHPQVAIQDVGALGVFHPRRRQPQIHSVMPLIT